MDYNPEKIDEDDFLAQGFDLKANPLIPAVRIPSDPFFPDWDNQPKLVGTVLAISIDPLKTGSTGRPLLARLSQWGYQVHWVTMSFPHPQPLPRLMGIDRVMPDLIVIETQRAEILLSPDYQRKLAVLNMAVIPTVLLTQAPPLLSSTAALQALGIINIWSEPILDDLAVLKQLKIYMTLGQRTQFLLEQKQGLTKLLKERDRNLRQHYAIEMVMRQQKQLLERLAFIDGLTQIPNRRYLDVTLAQEWQRSQREGSPLSLILCDVDYFKSYNDTYGHPKGDHCLRQIAAALKKAVKRPGDFVGRYGGEEFAIVLPNTDQDGAQRVGASIQARVKALSLAHRTSTVKPYVTLSLGIASLMPKPYMFLEELLHLADQALYEAKMRGRDQAVVNVAKQSEELCPDRAVNRVPLDATECKVESDAR